MIGGKRHIGLAGYPPRITDEDVPLPLDDHQDERGPAGAALTSMAHPGSVPQDLDPDSIEYDEIDAPAPLEDLERRISELSAVVGQRMSALEKQLLADRDALGGSDAQFARSLLDFNERLTRIEKQIAFMSSAQAMQEKQMSLHKRATALDLAIKACGSDVTAGDLTGTADAFVIWLEAGVSG